MSSSVPPLGRATALVGAVALAAGLVVAAPTREASARPAAPKAPVAAPKVETVTLVTGDVVQVSTGSDGRQAVTVRPRPDGSIPQAAINQVHDHLYVVPVEAFGLLAAHRLDRDLFDVTRLLDYAYDDASRGTLPVMVDYGRGPAAAAESRAASFAGAERTVTVPRLGVTAFHAEKTDARAFWADLTKGADDAGNPTALTDGAVRVDLDGKVEVALEDSVPQIHAPRGLGGRLRRRRLHRRGAGHGLRRHPPRPRRPGRRLRELHHRRDRHRRQRARDARRLDRRGQRRGLRRPAQGGGTGREAARRQGALRRGLRRGLVGARRHGLGGRPRRRRHQHEPRRRHRRRLAPAVAGGQRAVRHLRQPVRHRRRQQRRPGRLDGLLAGGGRRRAHRRRRRRARPDGALLQPRPSLPQRCDEARGRRPRRRRHRRPRGRHRARPRRRRALHHDQRHLDGDAARRRSRGDPPPAAPRLDRRAAEVGHRQQHRAGRRRHRLRRRHRPGRRPHHDQPGRARPGVAVARLLRLALRRPGGDLHDAHLRQHRGHRRRAVAGADGRGRFAGADRLHVAADRPGDRPGPRHRLGRRRPGPDGRRPGRLLGRGHGHSRTTGAAPSARAWRTSSSPRRTTSRSPSSRGPARRTSPTASVSAASASRGSTSSARSTPSPARRARRSDSRRATTRPARSPSARARTAPRRAS